MGDHNTRRQRARVGRCQVRTRELPLGCLRCPAIRWTDQLRHPPGPAVGTKPATVNLSHVNRTGKQPSDQHGAAPP
jgi:hypothetical protein